MKLTAKDFLMAIGFTFLLGAFACNEGDDTPALDDGESNGSNLCTPDDTKKCACTDGAKSTQVCAANGNKWKPCKCGVADNAAGPDCQSGQ